MFASGDAENTIVHHGVQRLHLLAIGFAQGQNSISGHKWTRLYWSGGPTSSPRSKRRSPRLGR